RTAAMAIFGSGIPKAGIGFAKTASKSRFTGMTRTASWSNTHTPALERSGRMRRFAISRFTKLPLLPNGKAVGCRRSSNGKRQVEDFVGDCVGNGQIVHIFP